MSLLFEDCFKRFNSDIKRNADIILVSGGHDQRRDDWRPEASSSSYYIIMIVVVVVQVKPNRTEPFDVLKHFRLDTITNGEASRRRCRPAAAGLLRCQRRDHFAPTSTSPRPAAASITLLPGSCVVQACPTPSPLATGT